MTALATIRERLGDVPVDVALVLGSGLAGLVNMIEDATIIPYRDLAGFPGHGSATMVSGHGSDLVIGRLHGKTVAVLTGREHYYERGNAAAMRVPLETLAAMGAKTLMLTNAAGSLDEKARPGDLMLISDHINYAGANPLIGENSDRRFVSLVDAYDPELRRTAMLLAEEMDIPLTEGVYIWFSGPSFESVAEIRMAAALGADAVGMSTVPEVIIGRMLGLRVWACSGITNMGAGMALEEISHAQTKNVAAICARKFEKLIPAMLEAI